MPPRIAMPVTTAATYPIPPDEMLTVTEAAGLARRSPRTIRRAYRHGRLAAYRDGNGRGVRVRYEDLRQWMMSRAAGSRVNTPGEVIGETRKAKLSASHPRTTENLRLLRAARGRSEGRATSRSKRRA
jgi:excisionase family DNA binding protein